VLLKPGEFVLGLRGTRDAEKGIVRHYDDTTEWNYTGVGDAI